MILTKRHVMKHLLQNKVFDLIVVTRPGSDQDDMNSKMIAILTMLSKYGVIIENFTCVEADELNENIKNDNARIICAIGGDGTFATACRRFAGGSHDIVIGFQHGSLNFMNAFTFERGVIDEMVMCGSNKKSIRTLGLANISDSEIHFTNDVVLQPTENFEMDVYEIRDGRGRYISSFRSDGVIISTSMGSTAYNLSAGGPILHPTMQAYIITPKLATHIGSRPIVLPMDVGLEIYTKKKTAVLQDGVFFTSFTPDEAPIYFRRGTNINVLLPNEYSFFEQARDKLGWFK